MTEIATQSLVRPAAPGFQYTASNAAYALHDAKNATGIEVTFHDKHQQADRY